MAGDGTTPGGAPSAGLLAWRIVLRPHLAPSPLPPILLTRSGAFHHENMPAEVAMLLPAGEGSTALVDDIAARPSMARDAILGLFLASPLINVDIAADRLACAGLRWVANLPSVTQQDEEFSRQLVDVGLDAAREYRHLARFKEHGFGVAAAVSDAAGASAAAAISPEVIIVMPRVADFAAGFPSLRQRASAVQSVHDAVRATGWRGVLLGLGEAREAASEGLWPPRADGLLCRPKPADR